MHNEIVLSCSKMVHVAVCVKMMSNTDSCPVKVILMIVIWIGQRQSLVMGEAELINIPFRISERTELCALACPTFSFQQ